MDKNQLLEIIKNENLHSDIIAQANQVRLQRYGKDVYFRGLIEFTSYCKNGCYYCGINCKNQNAQRYRLTKDEILESCQFGHKLGFRTFVLQGGEDPYFTDEILCDMIVAIRQSFPDCAITMSIGERDFDSYKKMFDAGANRYLLRHETAAEDLYGKLHPTYMNLSNRKTCLQNLKKIGFQTGAGFMVGSPYQTNEDLVEDLLFIKELQPEMVGIGPFLPHSETIFKDFDKGNLNKTILMVALARILVPNALLPATTALGTLTPKGRELALKAGANVVMPNLTPLKYRESYMLYDDKICTGDEASECIKCISKRIISSGFEPCFDRGDAIK